MSPAPWIIAGGGLLAIIGSVLPWGTVRSAFGQVDVSGTEGDGVLTLVLGLVVGALGLSSLAGARRVLAIVALLPTVGIAGIAAYDLANITEVADELSGSFVQVSAGPGLWVVLAGAAVALVGAIIGTANG